VTPLLGIFASANTTVANSYESIAVSSVGSGGASSITFASIPGTYTHLQVRYIGRDNRAGTDSDDIYFQFNSDSTTANYNSHRLYGNGSSVSADRVTGYAGTLSAFVSASTATASVFGGGVTDVLDYANINKYKTTRSIGGYDNNGSGFISLISGLWLSTSAITTITIYPLNGTSFNQHSHFALYGIKGPA
jgi:hypothetical protein